MAGSYDVVWSHRFVTGDRELSLEVRRPRIGDKYMVISTVENTEGGGQRSRSITVAHDQFMDFSLSYINAMQFMGPDFEPSVDYVKQLRKKHPKAYAKWTPEEDSLLRERLAAGTTVEELAKLHERQPGAITTRIKTLGLNGPGAKPEAAADSVKNQSPKTGTPCAAMTNDQRSKDGV